MRTSRLLLAVAAAVVLSLALAGRAGAVVPNDFTIPSAKVSVTHETADCGGGPSGGESAPIGPAVISCASPDLHSDSYVVNATLDLTTQVDFGTDVTTNGLVIAFAPGTCAQNNNPFFAQIIPGNAVHKTVNKTKTIYSFDGNVAGFTFSFPLALLFDHLEMTIQVPSGTGTPALHVEANANLCALIGGPMAMIFDISGDESFDSDNDFACVDVPTPSFNTLDISSGYCFF